MEDETGKMFIISLLVIGVFWAFITGVFLFAGVTNPLVHVLTTGILLGVFYIYEKFKEDNS